jgi:hypothetical protein
MMRALFLLFASMLALGLTTAPTLAHKASDSYLTLEVDGATVSGQWDIALRDLDFAIGLDADDNGEITWGEVRARHAYIAAYALARLQLQAGGEECLAQAVQHLVDHHTDGAYAVLRWQAQCPAAATQLAIDYRLLFDLDPQHRGLLRLQHAGQTHSAVFAPDKAQQRFELARPDRLRQFGDYFVQGVWHIWIGIDHILFLLALLFPAVLLRVAGAWQAVPRFKPALWEVLKIVTSFTVAHSITLSLAALGLVSLPSRWVESAIALSVLLAAANNLRPTVMSRRWVAAFAFGLIHGFGFASVLAELGLPPDALVLALVGFNLGVEAGQVAIVGIFLPLAYALRATAFYRKAVLVAGSAVVALLALVWLAERALEIKLMPW